MGSAGKAGTGGGGGSAPLSSLSSPWLVVERGVEAIGGIFLRLDPLEPMDQRAEVAIERRRLLDLRAAAVGGVYPLETEEGMSLSHGAVQASSTAEPWSSSSPFSNASSRPARTPVVASDICGEGGSAV